MSGDYEFLCNMYGISGASGMKLSIKMSIFFNQKLGRHCCLWCNITSDELKIGRATRQQCTTECTLQSLSDKHQNFIADGGNLKRAKFFENVIGEAFFDVPLHQVNMTRYFL